MSDGARYVVLDIETQKGFNEIDRKRLHLLKVSVACVYDSGTGEIRFQRISSDRLYLRRVLELERSDVVVFEACTMAGWVFDLCGELGRRAKVANTSGEAWKSTLRLSGARAAQDGRQ